VSHSGKAPVPDASLAHGQELPLALLRIVIGWHFLYEGWAKFLQPGWTSEGYLKSSAGPLAALFHALGSNDGVVRVIDFLNIWGLILTGLALMLGVAVRKAAMGGMALLALYYLAHPPLFAPLTHGFHEGSYLLVNKNLVELFALLAVFFLPASRFGIEALWRAGEKREDGQAAFGPPPQRREFLAALAGLPVCGAFVLSVLKRHGWESFEELQLRGRQQGKDTFVSSATLKSFQFTSVSDLQGRLPYGRIGELGLSRMILGGNLIGGWSHARDLIYVSKLVRAYHHRDKIFETLALAERCGINAILTNPLLAEVINAYWRAGGRIRFISDCGGKDLLELIRKSIDRGAAACYVQGALADRLVQEHNFDLIAQGLELIRRNNLPGGIGGHKLATIQACVERGLRPDFWMKTLHKTDYWSAGMPGKPQHDNIWCEEPTETVEYMRKLKEPWIAFKVLAAGALEPKPAFRYAFESGADFLCVGMYDFQIVDDVNIALDVLNTGFARTRQWCA
jgi:uncharacterized membrane protein YphA (DoxX/SURF4 family)